MDLNRSEVIERLKGLNYKAPDQAFNRYMKFDEFKAEEVDDDILISEENLFKFLQNHSKKTITKTTFYANRVTIPKNKPSEDVNDNERIINGLEPEVRAFLVDKAKAHQTTIYKVIADYVNTSVQNKFREARLEILLDGVG